MLFTIALDIILVKNVTLQIFSCKYAKIPVDSYDSSPLEDFS